jgi:hypothetical protein
MAGASMTESNVVQAPGGPRAIRPEVQSVEQVSSRATNRNLTDDEILGLGVRTRTRRHDPRGTDDNGIEGTSSERGELGAESADDAGRSDGSDENAPGIADPEEFQEVFDANPELKRAWDEAQAYRELFSTPEEARSATKLLADVQTMDALFLSGRAEDHAELARMVAKLDPASFQSLAKAMKNLAAEAQRPKERGSDSHPAEGSSQQSGSSQKSADALASGQHQFFQEANAEAVKSVVQAIETQVNRLLPDKVSSTARNRVIGEIYRELDKTLQSNGEFAKHLRGALRSGNLDDKHHTAVVSLIVGRARQALPGVAKRVLTEWTSTILTANQDRRAKQRSAESRVDIAGTRGGNDGARVRSPRDIDYGRMSDGDILNL